MRKADGEEPKQTSPSSNLTDKKRERERVRGRAKGEIPKTEKAEREWIKYSGILSRSFQKGE